MRNCALLDKELLSLPAHTFILCVKSYIDILSEVTHIRGMYDLARDHRQIGNAIRRARKERAWSQSDLARKVALRQETISLIETGSPSARIDTLLAVLAALDLEFRIAPRSKESDENMERLFT